MKQDQDQDLVVFSHGMMSHPNGTKIKEMSVVAQSKGFATVAPDYSSTYDPDERVEMLLALAPNPSRHLILVGSSMGSYVSTVASAQLKPTGLFLLAPAFYIEGYDQQEPIPHAQHTTLIHGWKDEVIPFENAVQFGQKHGSCVHLVPGDHRLMAALPKINGLFALFLDQMLKNSFSE